MIRRTSLSQRTRALAAVTCCTWALAMAGCRGEAPAKPAASQPAAAPVTQSASYGPVSLTVHLDRNRIIAPQTAALTLTVRAERGVTVKMPELKGALGGFLASEPAASQPAGNDMTDVIEQRYELEAVVPGEQEIPPIKVEYTDAREKGDGSHEPVTGSVTSEAIPVTVDLSLADVRDPATLPLPWPVRLLLWTIGTLAAMGLIVLLSRYFIRLRRKRRAAAQVARKVVAHEWALAELDRLIADDLVGRGLVQEFYYRINALVRRYIELRFGLSAGEQTSEEFLRALQTTSILREDHKRLLREFTAACDPVKYAAIVPDRAAIAWVTDSARRFIRETAAQPRENGDGSAGPAAGDDRASATRSEPFVNMANAASPVEASSREANR